MKKLSLLPLMIAAAIGLTTAGPLLAQASAKLLPAQSEIVFVSKQMGVPVEGKFSGSDVRKAIEGHVVARAQLTGTYTLNPRLALMVA